MKRIFEEPTVCVERFTVTDQTLTASWVPDFGDDDQTTPYSHPYGGTEAIISDS